MTTTAATTAIHPRHQASGRGWAYTGAILGGAVSVAANVAHSFIPPTNAPDSWTPEPGAVIGAIVWPVFLFIAIEILARTAWPTGTGWRWLRWGGLLPVGIVAALVSYRHLSGLLAHYNEEPLVVVLGPLAVDGLMAMATGALIATSRARHTTPDEPAAHGEHVDGEDQVDELVDEPHAPPTRPAARPAIGPADTSPAPLEVPQFLLPTARFAIAQHEQATGQPITAGELAARMSVPTATAEQLLIATGHPTTAGRVNGTPVTTTVSTAP